MILAGIACNESRYQHPRFSNDGQKQKSVPIAMSLSRTAAAESRSGDRGWIVKSGFSKAI
jgi:hypothetical protein